MAKRDQPGKPSKCATCGKAAYLSRADAKRSGKALHPGRPMRAYKCGQWWHLTSTDTATTTWYREYVPRDLRS